MQASTPSRINATPHRSCRKQASNRRAARIERWAGVGEQHCPYDTGRACRRVVMGEIAFELLCMHRTLRFDEIAERWVSHGGWMLQTMPRCNGQRENLVRPETVPSSETKPHERCYCKDGQQQPNLLPRIHGLSSPIFSGAPSSGLFALTQRLRPRSRYGPTPNA